MGLIEFLVNVFAQFPGKALLESMARSKTLTIMVVVGVILFLGGFAALIHAIDTANQSVVSP
ncbi:hypothetical protein HMF8227_01661 [Saliniradius amylolyticus]|uniref:Uncharacterized protein n=1 Tax=Saliniradius amylolyticus TaxID=2183582 RepID=A0A2S2E3B7_9ALTE|nr:hypothetical protein [Saliniradius amylolyticus]AWL12134.1 hypothetical protein HMF8227_01661 [Saliniradius amylolyticus]